MKPLLVVALVLTAVAATQLVEANEAHAAGNDGPFLVAETGKRFYRLDDAVRSIGGRDGTIRIAPGRYHDCASVDGGRVAFVAETPGSVTIEGTACEGKAALVLRGRAAAVDGIIFQNIHVPDGNGAGIRLEKGNLEVRNASFRDSEEGILSADDPASSVSIDQSTFERLGRCDRGLSCAHSVYFGRYGAVRITHSRFAEGQGGHYFKSRAIRNEVVDNAFDDARGHQTNYAVDLCAGSTGRVAGNQFVIGRDKENHSAIITVAAESRDNRSAGLQISGNRASLAPGVDFPTTFVADWSHEPLAIGQNQLARGIQPFETR